MSKVFSDNDFNSGDGMLTSIWGPSLWHSLHTISFNYPVKPTTDDKKNYMNFIKSLVHVLPCKYCRENLKKNFKELPLRISVFKNRFTFSKYIYELHEHINKMLGKKSNLSYEQVRERYEHFRARCIDNKPSKKEKGCTKSLYGLKGKCVINIVPKQEKCKTFYVDKRCKIKKNKNKK